MMKNSELEKRQAYTFNCLTYGEFNLSDKTIVTDHDGIVIKQEKEGIVHSIRIPAKEVNDFTMLFRTVLNLRKVSND